MHPLSFRLVVRFEFPRRVKYFSTLCLHARRIFCIILTETAEVAHTSGCRRNLTKIKGSNIMATKKVAKKAPAKKVVAKMAPAKKAPAKKACCKCAKKAPAKKAPAKKVAKKPAKKAAKK